MELKIRIIFSSSVQDIQTYRTKLKQEIQRIWTDSGRNGSPRWSVALLLAPSSVIAFTKAQSRAVLAATFEFIKQSGRQL